MGLSRSIDKIKTKLWCFSNKWSGSKSNSYKFSHCFISRWEIICLPTEKWSNRQGKKQKQSSLLGCMKINMQLYTFGSYFQSILQNVATVALAKDSEKSTILSAGEKGQNHTSAPAITARIVLACHSIQEILMDLYLGWDRGERRGVRKKSSQHSVLGSRNSTEAFVYLLVDCAVVRFFPHWCGMTCQTLCWKGKFTNSISKYKQVTRTYSQQWKFSLSYQ